MVIVLKNTVVNKHLDKIFFINIIASKLAKEVLMNHQRNHRHLVSVLSLVGVVVVLPGIVVWYL
jgi:peptide subunit release factor RF-3